MRSKRERSVPSLEEQSFVKAALRHPLRSPQRHEHSCCARGCLRQEPIAIMQYSGSLNSDRISPSISYLTVSKSKSSPNTLELSQVHRVVAVVSRSRILRWEVMRRFELSAECR